MKKIEISVRSKAEEHHTISLDNKKIIELLNTVVGFEIPKDARVTVGVPGGGDWSNTDLVIGEDSQIDIQWTVSNSHDSKYVSGENDQEQVV